MRVATNSHIINYTNSISDEIIIGASLSEPHTYVKLGDFVKMFIINIFLRMPFRIMLHVLF